MSREDALVEVFREYSSEWNNSEEAAVDVLAAADAHDAAHGIHRLVIDDATVERAARVIASFVTMCAWGDLGPHTRNAYLDQARAVLAAAVEADGA